MSCEYSFALVMCSEGQEVSFCLVYDLVGQVVEHHISALEFRIEWRRNESVQCGDVVESNFLVCLVSGRSGRHDWAARVPRGLSEWAALARVDPPFCPALVRGVAGFGADCAMAS